VEQVVTRARTATLALAVTTLAGALLVAAGARADVTIGDTPAGKPPRCDDHDGAYWRDRELPEVKRAQPLAGALSFIARSPHFIVFSSRWAQPDRPRGTVVDGAGEHVVAELHVEPSAAIETPAGALEGVLAVARHYDGNPLGDTLTFVRPDGTLRWRANVQDGWRDSIAVARDGDRLYLALFNRIATGSALIAVDAATGAVYWRADVQQLNVGHSKYFNDVTVELSGGVLTMRGTEAAGCYIQRFDAASGRRLSSTIFH
jgi:hypothetical protein